MLFCTTVLRFEHDRPFHVLAEIIFRLEAPSTREVRVVFFLFGEAPVKNMTRSTCGGYVTCPNCTAVGGGRTVNGSGGT